MDELGFRVGCALLELKFNNLIIKLDLSKTIHLVVYSHAAKP